MCEAMRWAVLPVAGGLYDQHPKLLEEWEYIFAAKSEQAKREQAAEKNKPKPRK